MIATYQIQMALKEIKPKIWRRLLIPSNLLLSDLHKVIQTSMGWDNLHLHQFIKKKLFILQKIQMTIGELIRWITKKLKFPIYYKKKMIE